MGATELYLTALAVFVAVGQWYVAYSLFQVRKAEKAIAGLVRITELMEGVRPNRTLVRSLFDSGKAWQEFDERERTSLDDLCRAFDTLGLYDNNKLIEQAIVDRFYACPLVELYEKGLGDYVQHLRESYRGETHYWELVCLYERVRIVPRNHPGLTNNNFQDWPKNARKEYTSKYNSNSSH